MSDDSAEILRRWLAAINGHDVPGLLALMATNFVFVDSLANRVVGAEHLEKGWRHYFALCPDYWVRGDHAMAEGDTMLLAGEGRAEQSTASPGERPQHGKQCSATAA
jgi:ketosteroid isomerase-like protein